MNNLKKKLDELKKNRVPNTNQKNHLQIGTNDEEKQKKRNKLESELQKKLSDLEKKLNDPEATNEKNKEEAMKKLNSDLHIAEARLRMLNKQKGENKEAMMESLSNTINGLKTELMTLDGQNLKKTKTEQFKLKTKLHIAEARLRMLNKQKGENKEAVKKNNISRKGSLSPKEAFLDQIMKLRDAE